MSRAALLVDTGFSAKPIYAAIQARGWETAVIGNKPDDCLQALATAGFVADYSKVAELSALYRERGFQALVPGCTDVSYRSCSAVASELSAPGIDDVDTTDRILDKAKFRDLCTELEIPSPRKYDTVDNIDRSHAVIVKPVDAYSGLGITVLHGPEDALLREARALAESNSRTRAALVEEFVSGQLFSSSCFIREGRIDKSFLVEEHCGENSFSVSASRVIDETPGANRRPVERHLTNIASHLRLVDGLLHLQWIESENEFWFIELTRRCPGDLYSQLIGLATGFDYASCYAAPFLESDDLPGTAPNNTESTVIRLTVHGKPGHRFGHLNLTGAGQLLEYHPLVRNGDTIPASGRIGVMFLSIGDTAGPLTLRGNDHDVYYSVEYQST